MLDKCLGGCFHRKFNCMPICGLGGLRFIHMLQFPLHEHSMEIDQKHVRAMKGSHVTNVNTSIGAAS